MPVQKKSKWRLAGEYGAVVLGSILFAFSIQLFFAPNQIAPGGFSGFATILNYLFSFPIGITMIVLNLPLFLFAYRDVGKSVFWKAIIATILFSVVLDLFDFLPAVSHDKLLVSLVGGAVNGAGYGLIFSAGGSSGGSDLLARILQKRVPHVSLGKLLMTIDGVVIATSAIAYRNIESALYAVIAVYVSSQIVDAILLGADFAKTIYIITDKPRELSGAIIERLKRGVTEIAGEGAYTRNKKTVLLTVIRPKQITVLKEIIKEHDKQAFVIVTSANEVLGAGFKHH